MDKRYQRNFAAITEEEQLLLKEKRLLIAGCGGLGGYLLEFMMRLGVGKITAVDGDCFDVTNLNRQLLCTDQNLGCGKAATAAERANIVNPDVTVIPVCEMFTEENADLLVEGQDLVLDALDNVSSRLLLEDTCARYKVPLVHGAVQGWYAQVSVVMPGSSILHTIYRDDRAVHSKTILPFTPPLCASIQAAEATKLLCGRRSELENSLLLVNALDMSFDKIKLR